MTSTAPAPADLGGTFSIGGDLPVRRIGYGAMQITGPGHWFHPTDMDEAKAVLREAIDLGINHIDTADAYGPETSERLIRKALHPYPDDLVIATKGGMTRQGPNRWAPVGRPEYLRQCVEMSLRRLALERIDLYYLHRIDPHVPLADQLGELAALREEGKIRHIGISKATLTQVEAARAVTPIAAVQNKFNQLEGDRTVLEYCTEHGLAFVPYAPLSAGALARDGGAPEAITWLLDKSPAVLPIPGTTSIDHLHANLAAATRRKA